MHYKKELFKIKDLFDEHIKSLTKEGEKIQKKWVLDQIHRHVDEIFENTETVHTNHLSNRK